MFALELVSGHLYLHLDLGSGAVKVKATTRRVDDGLWHEIMLRRNGKEGRLTVDENAADFSTPGNCLFVNNVWFYFYLESHIYIVC